MSLNIHFCNCGSISSTCKHILALQLIAKEFYSSFNIDVISYFNDDVISSSNANVEPTFKPLIENVYSQDFMLFMNECISEINNDKEFI